MSPPSAHLVSSTVARGEPVRLVIDALQGRNEWYFAELDAWNTDRWEQVENSHADYEAVVNVEQLYLTPHLAPGRYRLRLACEAVGYDQAWSSDLNETSLVFDVTQPQGDVPEVALYFARNTSLSFEQITFWTWAEGADHVHVTVTKEDEEFWRNDIDEDGGLQRINWSSSDSGTHIFTLTAYYGDEERTAEPFVLVQSAPYGTLQAPEISGVPGVIEVGQSVSGSVGTRSLSSQLVPSSSKWPICFVLLTWRPMQGTITWFWDTGRNPGNSKPCGRGTRTVTIHSVFPAR